MVALTRDGGKDYSGDTLHLDCDCRDCQTVATSSPK
jgi:hypothetical protein